MSAAARVKPRGKSVRPSTARRPAVGGRRTRPSAPATTVANGGGMPPRTPEPAHLRHPHLNSLGSQQFPLELQVSAVPSQQSPRGDHTVARYARLAAVTHDVADGA